MWGIGLVARIEISEAGLLARDELSLCKYLALALTDCFLPDDKADHKADPIKDRNGTGEKFTKRRYNL